jgi:glycosyltransferase involved in cell wall biosynthesis
MNASFTVVTPSYNQGRFLRATIESVLAQKIPDLQYLVMDGGSSDESISLLNEYSAHLQFVSERDEGTADAVNKGLALSKGEIIGWLNSDDIYYPNALNRVYELFEGFPDTEVVYGRANHIDEHGCVIDEYQTEEWSLAALVNHCIISQPAAFFRRSVIEKYGPLATAHRYCVDYEFWMRLARRGARFRYVPEYFAATRLHQQAKTVASRLQCHLDINDIMVEHLGHLPSRWIANFAHIKAEKLVKRSGNECIFFVVLVMQCLLTDLHWNNKISSSTLRMLGGWIFGRLLRRLSTHSQERYEDRL